MKKTVLLALGFWTGLTQGAQAPANYLAFTTDYPSVYDIAGFEWTSRLEYFHVFDSPAKHHNVSYAGQIYRVGWDAAGLILSVQGGTPAVQLAVSLMPLMQKLIEKGAARTVAQAELTLEDVQAGKKLRVYIEDFAAEWPAGASPTVYHLKADVLWSSHGPKAP